MESNNRFVIIEPSELEAMIERAVERKLREVLNHDNKSLGRDGRMSLTDVMEAFNVSKQTIYNWIKEDKLPKPARIGRRLYWSPEAIKAMMP
jgi:predicted DNA-binding transcriptional regulator AlpA